MLLQERERLLALVGIHFPSRVQHLMQLKGL